MSPRMVTASELIGRTITAFDPGAIVAGEGGMRRTMHEPRLMLDDGSRLYFVAEEHPEGDWYGVFIGRAIPRRETRG